MKREIFPESGLICACEMYFKAKIVHTCYQRSFKDLARDLFKSARFAPDLLVDLGLPWATFKRMSKHQPKNEKNRC